MKKFVKTLVLMLIFVMTFTSCKPSIRNPEKLAKKYVDEGYECIIAYNTDFGLEQFMPVGFDDASEILVIFEDMESMSNGKLGLFVYFSSLKDARDFEDDFKDWTEENSGMDWEDALEDLEDEGMLFFRKGKVVYFGLEEFYDEL